MRRWLLLLFCIIFLIPFSAFAHSGKTDSRGGHTDHSTGDYHYHHGYSAHDHYDMNGDGTADCPYDFNDRTGKNSGTTSTSSRSGNTSTKIVTVYQDKEVIKEVPYTPPLMKWALGMCIFMIFFLLVVILMKSSENAKLRESICHLEIELRKQKEQKSFKLEDMIYR